MHCTPVGDVPPLEKASPGQSLPLPEDVHPVPQPRLRRRTGRTGTAGRTSTWRNSPAIWRSPARGTAWTAGRPTRLGTIAPEHAFNLRLGPVAVHRCPAGVALGHDFTPVGDAPPPEEASPSQSPPPPEDVRPVTQHSPAGDVRATHFPVSSRIAAIRRAVFAKCSTSSGSSGLPRTLLSR